MAADPSAGREAGRRCEVRSYHNNALVEKQTGRPDELRLTEWLRGSEKEASSHAGGASMRADAWLLAECAARTVKGDAVVVVDHPTLKGYAALYLQRGVKGGEK
jgi:hypothetical protein